MLNNLLRQTINIDVLSVQCNDIMIRITLHRNDIFIFYFTRNELKIE